MNKLNFSLVLFSIFLLSPHTIFSSHQVSSFCSRTEIDKSLPWSRQIYQATVRGNVKEIENLLQSKQRTDSDLLKMPLDIAEVEAKNHKYAPDYRAKYCQIYNLLSEYKYGALDEHKKLTIPSFEKMKQEQYTFHANLIKFHQTIKRAQSLSVVQTDQTEKNWIVNFQEKRSNSSHLCTSKKKNTNKACHAQEQKTAKYPVLILRPIIGKSSILRKKKKPNFNSRQQS